MVGRYGGAFVLVRILRNESEEEGRRYVLMLVRILWRGLGGLGRILVERVLMVERI